MLNRGGFRIIFLGISLLLVVSACVTTKKSKEEPGWLGRKMHDMNARYNGYFNAKELYSSSVDQLVTLHEDNYNQVLTIYPYGEEEDRETVRENMDIAIEKVVKVVALHPSSKWVDDCYVMMGKAQYLKGDYESAEETFEYFVDDFNPRDPDSRVYQGSNGKISAKQKKKEKEEERKEEQKTREEERKEKEKERKRKAKEREQAKKESKKRSRNRKTRDTEQQPEGQASNPAPATSVSVVDEAPLSEDEQYLRDLAAEQKKNQNKKIEEGKTGGFLKHKPAYYEGMLWLVKTFIAREKWLEANYYLDKLEKDPVPLKSVSQEIAVVRADYFLRQKDYRSAIPSLNLALETSPDRLLKARMAFILAQAYQMNGQAAEAQEAFDRVSKYKADFEMELQANLNQLRNEWASGKTSSEQVKRKLNREAREEKYRSYRGSIYATAAEVLLADGNEEEALEYFQKALAESSNNTVKTEIYYRLGTLYFGTEDYVQAKNYYDSTLQIMKEKDPRYNPTKAFATSLKDIAKNISIIEEQDSLLSLAGMPSEQLRTRLEKQAKKLLEEKQEAKKEESRGFEATTTVFAGNSKFFAYNQTSKQRGRQDFLRRWGNRPLEDNWRRSQKSSSVFDQEILEQEENLPAYTDEELQREVNRLMSSIPLSEKNRDESLAKVEKALFELGTGFRTMLNNYTRSNGTLLQLLDRFQETAYKPEAMYFIHLNFLDLGKGDMAESFKSRLIRNYPESDFAIFLKNPNNTTALLTEERKIEIYYENTYELFEKGDYSKAFKQLQVAKEQFGAKHDMIAKYDLLQAMCIGNLEGQNEYVNALRAIVLKYNNTPEQTYARELLRFLKGDEETFGEDVTEEELSKFLSEDNKLHYVIAVIYDVESDKITSAKEQVNQFNDKNYNEKRLRSTSLILSRENKSYILLVRRFVDKDDSMNYYKDVSGRLDEFMNTNDFSYDLYAINQKNYRRVVQEKSANAYRVFFDRNYLGIE